MMLQKTLHLIYKKLLEYLSQKQRFTQSGLNRKTVAYALRTNEKYLQKAIREFSKDQTLAKLISHMRINHAAELLMQHSGYTVEAIARECGFNSRRSFYRTFATFQGCTPIEYRTRCSQQEKTLKNKCLMKWKLKAGILLQEIGNQTLLVALNTDTTDKPQVISLNNTAAYMVKQMKTPCSEKELVGAICACYEVDEAQALIDTQTLINELSERHIIEEVQ